MQTAPIGPRSSSGHSHNRYADNAGCMRFQSHEDLFHLFEANGARQVVIKPLAENDNSKNQIYLAGTFEALQILPFGKVASDPAPKKPNFKAEMNLSWVSDSGWVAVAPHTQLILYPKYPEVRLSGFLRGCPTAPSELMRPPSRESRRGGADGRLLFLAVTQDRRVLAYVAAPDSVVARSARSATLLDRENDGRIFSVLDLAPIADGETRLIRAIAEIVTSGWHAGIKLDKSMRRVPYRGMNAAGYTLEALLGIIPNSIAGPDLLGWEVKTHSKSPITLMTPEPDDGVYVVDGVESFVRRYGHQTDSSTVYFTGRHVLNQICEKTSLRMALEGVEAGTWKISDVGGGLVLFDLAGEVAAKWSFARLIEHWGRKHNRAIFVHHEARSTDDGTKQFRYTGSIATGHGTEFRHFLQALAERVAYYDPGCRVREREGKVPDIKRRNQFRIRFADIARLYNRFTPRNLP